MKNRGGRAPPPAGRHLRANAQKRRAALKGIAPANSRYQNVLAQITRHLADGDDAVAIAMPNDPSAARHPLKRGVLDDHQIVNRLLLKQAAGTGEDRFAPADQTVPPREVLRRARARVARAAA